jgi:hypothetical protein
MDAPYVNPRAAEPLPENLESLTIAQLGRLGEDRGYSACNGKKKVDYTKRIRAQYEDAVAERDADIAREELFDKESANLGAINTAREQADKRQLDYTRKRDMMLDIVA